MFYKLYKKILWLGYRLNITFKFFFKIFFVFKIISIFYDIYLGHYPKIFNDQGMHMRFNDLINYLDLIFLNYYREALFFIFVFFFIAIYSWPHFFDVRVWREHVYIRKAAEKEAKRLISAKLRVYFEFEKKFKAGLNKYFWPFYEEKRVYTKKARLKRKRYKKGEVKKFLKKFLRKKL